MTRWRAVFCIASALPPGPGSQNVYQVIIQVGNYERILIGKHPAPHVYAKAPLIRWMPLNEARPRDGPVGRCLSASAGVAAAPPVLFVLRSPGS